MLSGYTCRPTGFNLFFTKSFVLFPQFKFCSGRKFPLMGISMLAKIMDGNYQQIKCIIIKYCLQPHETKNSSESCCLVLHLKVVGITKKFGGGH